MDDHEWSSIAPVIEESAKVRSWSNDTELLAAIHDQLVRIGNRLDAGIPVVEVKQTRKPDPVERYQRPEWWQGGGDPDVIVLSPSEAFRHMRG